MPDNLRSGVTRSHRYEPLLNRTYAEMAAHYGSAVLPARANKPRDKAKVEVGVQIAERWILASLRNERFTSLAEANTAIRARLAWLNNRPFAKLEGTRKILFEQLDRPAMRPLPATRYELGTWKTPKVNIDYHVDVDRHYYSVPYQLVGHRVEARVSEHVVEIFYRGRRVAGHRRSGVRGGHTTCEAHMPERHRAHLAWNPERLIAWAARTGPATAELVTAIMASRPHPELGYRSCLGILRLASATRPVGSRPPADARCSSAPAPTAASTPSWPTAWTPNPCPPATAPSTRPIRRAGTSSCAAPATTSNPTPGKENAHVGQPHRREAV